MEKIKLTKTALRQEQRKVDQLHSYLPTLQLKKAMLQKELADVHAEELELNDKLWKAKEKAESFSKLLGCERGAFDSFLVILHVQKHYENIAGIELPYFDGVQFREKDYPLIGTPVWWDPAIDLLREMVRQHERLLVAEEKRRVLAKELKEVSIRVNLFEKILIPRGASSIKKIKIFLGDQELAAVARAKIAKTKLKR